ncbi:MAG: glycosyltransferase family 2 protein [Culturomica sp.]|jgi:glycosyltransferase involved in cell wall biosynthesis|nr:glycosyltransferase family 2 protein [Culturomica sp.]
MKISVVINTYNAEQFLRRVLESVKGFDEIVVCDMHSTDSTVEIAEEYNCKVVYFEKHNVVEPARNFAIQSASYEWVLVVDADELVTPALRDYLYKCIEEPFSASGIFIPRKNYRMGRFMHGAYPDYVLRFFRRAGVYWSPEIHSVPRIEGEIITIPAKRKDLAFIHLVNNPLELEIRKTNIYTDDELKKRKGQKFSYCKMIYAPAFRFLKSFIFKGGFRDGKAGLVNAKLNAFYKFLTIAKVWEQEVDPDKIDKELKK